MITSKHPSQSPLTEQQAGPDWHRTGLSWASLREAGCLSAAEAMGCTTTICTDKPGGHQPRTLVRAIAGPLTQHRDP